MDRAVSGSDILSGSVFEGWNIGAVSVKRVRLQEGGAIEGEIRRHWGDPAGTICSMLDSGGRSPDGAVVTAPKPLRSSRCRIFRNRFA
jgi:hypothetical protein